MLSLPPRVVSRLVDAGFVSPSRGPRNSYEFSFQDVVVLRTAHQLHTARVPAHKILRALISLRASLPPQMPLTGLRIAAIGGDVAVIEGDQPWEAESGQLLFAFEVAGSPAGITFLDRSQSSTVDASGDELASAAWLEQALALEDHDLVGAEHAYRRAITDDPEPSIAYVNLGALLCNAGRCDEAVELLSEATQHFPLDALLHFNLAIALEDQQRPQEALESYSESLVLDEGLIDAHFNAARLYDRLGQFHLALRHYSAYRRLQKLGT